MISESQKWFQHGVPFYPQSPVQCPVIGDTCYICVGHGPGTCARSGGQRRQVTGSQGRMSSDDSANVCFGQGHTCQSEAENPETVYKSLLRKSKDLSLKDTYHILLGV